MGAVKGYIYLNYNIFIVSIYFCVAYMWPLCAKIDAKYNGYTAPI